MKQKTLLRFFITMVVIMGSWINISAANELTGTCPGYCDPQEGGETTIGPEDAFYMLINTEANGDITFKIMGVPGNTETVFRGNGWADGVVTGLTVNGNQNTDYQYFTRSINAEKTIITLVKQQDIPKDATIVINGVLEYKTYNTQPQGVPGNLTNLWPTVKFEFTYGTTCSFSQTPLDTPKIDDIDLDNKISFDDVDGAYGYRVYVYRDATLVYQQEINSGEVINFEPNLTYNYTVKLRAISNNINYLDSDFSDGYSWYLEVGQIELDPSIFCEYRIGNAAKEYVNFTWETDVSGNVVITLSGYAGDTGSFFRGNGMGADLSKFTVNSDSASNYFERSYGGDGTSTFTLVLKDGVSIVYGDKISYSSGTVEWRTSQEGNAYGTYSFIDYVYGSVCSGLPKVYVTPFAISFDPETDLQNFTISAENLTGDITINVPKGLSTNHASLSPDENGEIEETIIKISWDDGTSNGSIIKITGGGLAADVPILVNVTGFSDYCNKIIEFTTGGKEYPAYLTISLSGDKKEMYFDIAPVYGDEAIWKSNSIPAANILVNGNAPITTPTRSQDLDDTRIIISLDDALADDDVVTFGDPIVWETKSADLQVNSNCYINPAQTYTVGLTCEVDKGPATNATISNSTNFTLYPNPATDIIHFNENMRSVALYALQGQLVLRAENINKLDVSNINSGLYLIKAVSDDGKSVSAKIEVR